MFRGAKYSLRVIVRLCRYAFFSVGQDEHRCGAGVRCCVKWGVSFMCPSVSAGVRTRTD